MAKEDHSKYISQVVDASTNIHKRLFNHKHFIDGEISYFINNTEKEWGNVEQLFDEMQDRHQTKLSQRDDCKKLLDLERLKRLQEKADNLLEKSNEILSLEQTNERIRKLQTDDYSKRHQLKEEEIRSINQAKLDEVDKFYDSKKVEAAKYYHELESKWDV